MDRELLIKLALDRAAAEASGKAFAAAEAARIAQLVRASDAAEAAKAAVALAAAQRKADAAAIAGAREQQALTAVLSREQVVFQARDALVRRHNQERVDAELKAMQASQRGWSGTNTAVAGAAKAVGSFAFQMLGLSSAQAVLGTIVENFQRAKQEAMDAAKFVTGYREALLELAALKGQMGETGKTLREDVQFRAKTLQTAPAARAFQLAALGTGESAIGVNIAKAEFTRAMELAGKFQAIETEDPTAHGRLIGMLPSLMGGKGITGEQAFAKQQQLFRIFQPGGGSFGQLTNQFIQQAPLVSAGLFKDPAQMAALLSAFSGTNPEGAGTNVQQFTRGTVGALGRMRGANVEGLVEKQAQFLRRIGATDQMTPIEIGKLISGEFTKQEQVAEAGGQQFNAMTFLQQHGYMNQEDMMALMAFHGLQKSGRFEAKFESLAAAPPTTEEALAPIEKRMREDEVFRARKSEIGEELAKIKIGAGQEETLAPIMRDAFNKLKGERQVVGEFEDVMKLRSWDPTELFFGPRKQTEMEAQHALVGEAKRLGIEPGVSFRTEARTGERTEEFMGREGLYGLSQKILAAGGNLQPGFEGAAQGVERQLAALDAIRVELVKANEQRARQARPDPPINGRPAVPTR